MNKFQSFFYRFFPPKKIVVGYMEAGEFQEIDSFESKDISAIQALMSPEAAVEKANRERKVTQPKAVVKYMKSSIIALGSELSLALKSGKIYVGSGINSVSVDEENVTVGCTTITRKKFNQLAKLIS